MEEEKWRPVVGHEGLYEVSDLGRVRSLNTWSRSGFHVTGRMIPGRVLRLKTSRSGYAVVNLSSRPTSDGARSKKTWSVHRLVAEAFLENTSGGNDVNHIDFRPLNNRLNNLEWATRKENLRHSSRAGRLANRRGCPISSSTWAKVIRLLSADTPVDEVARSTGVSEASIFKAKHMFRDLFHCVTAVTQPSSGPGPSAVSGCSG